MHVKLFEQCMVHGRFLIYVCNVIPSSTYPVTFWLNLVEAIWNNARIFFVALFFSQLKRVFQKSNHLWGKSLFTILVLISTFRGMCFLKEIVCYNFVVEWSQFRLLWNAHCTMLLKHKGQFHCICTFFTYFLMNSNWEKCKCNIMPYVTTIIKRLSLRSGNDYRMPNGDQNCEKWGFGPQQLNIVSTDMLLCWDWSLMGVARGFPLASQCSVKTTTSRTTKTSFLFVHVAL
jgi:hypothetical protein